MEPLLAEELAVESYSPDEGVGVVAARENAVGRSVGAVEVGHGSKVSLAAVAIAGIVFLAASVIPVEGAGGSTTIAGIAVGIVEDGVDGSAGGSLEDGEVLLSANNASVAIAVVGGVGGIADGGLGGSLVDVVALAVA